MHSQRSKDQHSTTGNRMAKQAATSSETEADSAWSSTKETKTKEHRGPKGGLWRYQETNKSYQVCAFLVLCLCISGIMSPCLHCLSCLGTCYNQTKKTVTPMSTLHSDLSHLLAQRLQKNSSKRRSLR